MGRSLSQTVKSKQSKQQPRKRQKHDERQSPTPSPTSPAPTRANSSFVKKEKRQLEEDDVISAQSTCTTPAALLSRPKRRATNAHIIRFLQTRNPNKLEEEDLKRALEASLEECPDFWPAEDTASCSSSDQSNAPSASSNSSSTGGATTKAHYKTPYATNTTNGKQRRGRTNGCGGGPISKRNSQSLTMQHHHQFSNICNCQQTSNSNNNINYPPNSNCALAYTNRCPMSTVHNRYKPVTKKNIYSESDFFHDGIMEYIEYELKQRGLIE